MNEEFQGLSLVELIDLLEEVPEPEPIPFTPQTPGWIVLGIVVALLVYFGVRAYLRHRKANAYRRAALKELEGAKHDPAKIAEVIRRTALVAFPRAEVASLTGDAWLAFLDKSYPGSGFKDGPGRIIASAPYRDQGETPEAASLAKDWVRRHKRKAAA